ncbi:DUF4129 domain-containing protein [Pararcticibacter amylolyticus]|uniref:Protein-glutamine gamma-glutamyltransferase-like C-terminal domain-containing protein n=1 Tax=Pararcticibacter amylolyticus TaxID=2173175 RepID=A0A2U2PA88_9SPHI|nr:DUF4129 domain-containing protein [Pararcticibacter amylolyticus]PWG78280.1 hypothetical protein DDR33_23170 [Pararcticibacter amylolyticus]
MKTINIRLPILLLMTLFFSLWGKEAISASVKKDSTAVSLRTFNQGELNKYRSNAEFNYEEGGEDVSLSWWDQFWNRVWTWIRRWFGNIEKPGLSHSPGYWKYIFLTLIAGVLIYILIKSKGLSLSGLFSRKSPSIEVPYTEFSEDIHGISFDEEMGKAVEARDFRLAVRLLYLRSLKHLSEAGKIKWVPGKTNSEYVRELRHTEQRRIFSVLTREFEYIWYGNFPVDNRMFDRIRNAFADFDKGGYK